MCLQTCTKGRISWLHGRLSSNEDFSSFKDLLKQCRKLVRQRTVSAQRLAHLIGKMTATIPAVLPAALHYRALQWSKNKILWRNKQDYSATGILDKESKEDLTWWSSHLPKQNGRALITPLVKNRMHQPRVGVHTVGGREQEAPGRGWKRINT